MKMSIVLHNHIEINNFTCQFVLYKASIMDAARPYSQKLNETIPPNQVAGTLTVANTLFSIWPYRLIRVILAGIFLWSGLSKLLDPASFVVIIDAFGLIPESWTMPVAYMLPALEIVAAVGLLMDIRGSLAVVSGMLALFMGLLLYGIHLGLDIDCGCFGPQDPEAEAFHSLRPALYRDFVMMAGVMYLYFWRYYRQTERFKF